MLLRYGAFSNNISLCSIITAQISTRLLQSAVQHLSVVIVAFPHGLDVPSVEAAPVFWVSNPRCIPRFLNSKLQDPYLVSGPWGPHQWLLTNPPVSRKVQGDTVSKREIRRKDVLHTVAAPKADVVLHRSILILLCVLLVSLITMTTWFCWRRSSVASSWI